MNSTTSTADFLRAELEKDEGMKGKRSKLAAKKPGSEDDDAEKMLEENLWKYYRLFPPKGYVKMHWDPVIQLLVMYNCIFIPMSLAFAYKMDSTHLLIDYCIDCFFVIDMLISCSTVYYNQHYEMVIDRRSIISHYLRTWLLIDLLSILPLEVFALLIRSESTQAVVADLLKLPRMLRLARFRKRVDMMSGANVTRMIWLTILFLFTAHLVACTWWGIGRLGLPSDQGGLEIGVDDHSTSWILRAQQGTSSSLWPHNAPPNSRFGQQYITSFYWALTALLKTPSVTPDTPLEKLFTTVVTIFGVLLFTIFVGNTIEVLQAVSHSDEARRRHVSNLLDFTRQARLSRKLRRQIFAHSAAEYRATLGIDAAALLHQFPRTLRGQIVVFMHRHTLRQSELFSAVSTECAKALLMCLTPTVCLQKELLLGQGELCEFFYILQRGALQVRNCPASDLERLDDGEEGDGYEFGRAVVRAIKRVSCIGMSMLGLPVNGNLGAAPSPAPRDKSPPGARAATRRAPMHYHAIERSGAILGLNDPNESSILYPYSVVASKTASLLRVTGSDVRTVLTAFGGKDEAAARQHLLGEYDEITAAMLAAPRESRFRPDLSGRVSRPCANRPNSFMTDSSEGGTPPCGTPKGGGAIHPALMQAMRSNAPPSPVAGSSTDAAASAACDESGAAASPVGSPLACTAGAPTACQVGGLLSPAGASNGRSAHFGGEIGAANSNGGASREPTPSERRERPAIRQHLAGGPSAAAALPSRPTEGTLSQEETAERHRRREVGVATGERKNSIMLSASTMAPGERAEDAKAAEDRQRHADDLKWREQMDDLRSEIASAGRKLQSLLSTIGHVESELALIPQIAEALTALDTLGTGSPAALSASASTSVAGAERSATLPARSPQRSGLFAPFSGWFQDSRNTPMPSTTSHASGAAAVSPLEIPQQAPVEEGPSSGVERSQHIRGQSSPTAPASW